MYGLHSSNQMCHSWGGGGHCGKHVRRSEHQKRATLVNKSTYLAPVGKHTHRQFPTPPFLKKPVGKPSKPQTPPSTFPEGVWTCILTIPAPTTTNLYWCGRWPCDDFASPAIATKTRIAHNSPKHSLHTCLNKGHTFRNATPPSREYPRHSAQSLKDAAASWMILCAACLSPCETRWCTAAATSLRSQGHPSVPLASEGGVTPWGVPPPAATPAPCRRCPPRC